MSDTDLLTAAGTAEAITAYELPFPFLYTSFPELSRGGAATLEVLFKGGITDSDTSNVDSLVTAFYMLASTGALSGDAVPPWESNVAHPSRPEQTDMSLRWHFHSTNVSQPAATILAQLINIGAATSLIERVIFTVRNGHGLAALRSDPRLRDWYPRTWIDLPYEFTIAEETGKTAMLSVAFRRQIAISERRPIEIELLTWATATRIGSYGIAPVPAERCGLVPDESATFFEDELEISFHDISCHPAAFRGLLNVCAAIDRKLVPIRSVTLQ
jgi:hypothetical protein